MSQPNINKRRPSFPSADSSNVLRNIDKQNPLASPKIAWIKHGKYIALGGGGVAYFDIVDRIRWSLASENWVRWIARLGVGLHGLTVVIFLYLVLFLPWIRGYTPNYPSWQQSARLRTIVPLLTIAILLGWTSYVIALSQAGKPSIIDALGDAVKAVGNGAPSQLEGEAGLGIWRAMAGSTAIYVLTLGCLGLIPSPSKLIVDEKTK